MGLNITLSISDEDQKILEDNLINPELWIKTMVSENTANCYSRLQQKWTVKLMEDSEFTDAIPSNKSDFITLVTERSDYKTAKEISEQ